MMKATASVTVAKSHLDRLHEIAFYVDVALNRIPSPLLGSFPHEENKANKAHPTHFALRSNTALADPQIA